MFAAGGMIGLGNLPGDNYISDDAHGISGDGAVVASFGASCGRHGTSHHVKRRHQ